MFDGMMVGGSQAFEPVQQSIDDCLSGLRNLAVAMISRAINDISKPKFNENALRWVNDVHADGLTSFTSVCEISGRNPDRLRESINRYAESGKNIDHFNLTYMEMKKHLPGRKKKNTCAMEGCYHLSAGKYCWPCMRIISTRKHLYPDRPELWHLPKQPKGGRTTLPQVYENLNEKASV